jgi:hypothetical protein
VPGGFDQRFATARDSLMMEPAQVLTVEGRREQVPAVIVRLVAPLVIHFEQRAAIAEFVPRIGALRGKCGTRHPRVCGRAG